MSSTQSLAAPRSLFAVLASSLVLAGACGGTPEKAGPQPHDGSPAATDGAGAPDSGGAPGADSGSPLDVADVKLAVDAGGGDSARDTAPVPTDAGVAATTRMKFCNQLKGSNGQSIVVTLEIGQPIVRFTASTGTCTPALGTPCTPVTVGRTPATLYEGTRMITTTTYTVRAGLPAVLVASPADDMGGVDLQEALLNPLVVDCSTFEPGLRP